MQIANYLNPSLIFMSKADLWVGSYPCVQKVLKFAVTNTLAYTIGVLITTVKRFRVQGE
jgi:hypothetical protein